MQSKPLTFMGYLRRLTWDEVLQIIIESNPYYRKRNVDDGAEGNKYTAAAADPGEGWLARLKRCVRSYFVTSSELRLAVHGFVALYTLWALFARTHYAPSEVQQNEKALGFKYQKSVSGVLYESIEGLQLVLRSMPPRLRLMLYSLSGTMLLPLAVSMAEVLPYMCHYPPNVAPVPAAAEEAGNKHYHTATAAATTAASIPPASETRVQLVRLAHKVAGAITLTTMTAMVVAGVGMRLYSIFAGRTNDNHGGLLDFLNANVWLAIPWFLLAPMVGLTSRLNQAFAHAMVGLIVLNTCVAVPLTRIMGALYQRLAGLHVPIGRSMHGRAVRLSQAHAQALQGAYYAGLLSAACVVGTFAVFSYKRAIQAAHARYEVFYKSNHGHTVHESVNPAQNAQ